METKLYLERAHPNSPRAPGYLDRAEVLKSAEIGELKRLTLKTLELHDLIISKLERFGADDQEDMRTMSQDESFDEDVLLQRYKSARANYLMEHERLEKLDHNFNRIRTEILGLEAVRWAADY